MALVLGVLDNYVVDGYIEDPNSYVLGPAAVVSAVSVQATIVVFVAGASATAASFSWHATADPIFRLATVDIQAEAATAATAVMIRGAATTMSAVVTQQTQAQPTLEPGTITSNVITTQVTTAENLTDSVTSATATVTQLTTAEVLQSATMLANSEATQVSAAQNLVQAELAIASALTAEQVANPLLGTEHLFIATTTTAITAEPVLATSIDLSVTAALSCAGDIFDFAEATLDAACTMSLLGEVILSTAELAVNTAVTTEIVGDKGVVHLPEINLNTAVTATMLGNQIHTMGADQEDIDWTTPASWDTWPYQRWGFTGRRVMRMDAAVAAAAQLIFDIQASFTSTTQQITDSTDTFPAAVDITVTTTQSTTATNLVPAQAVLAAEFTADYVPDNVILSSITMSAACTMSTDRTMTLGAGIESTVVAQQITLGGQDGSFEATLAPEFTVTAESGTTLFIAAEISAQAGMTVDVGVLQGAVSLQATLGTVAVAANNTVQTSVTTSLVMAQSTVAVLTNSPDIVMQALGATLIVGSELQTDLARQVKVSAQSRRLTVSAQPRTLHIPAQSRVLYLPVAPLNQQLRRVA